MAVKIVGWIHGILFIVYFCMAFQLSDEEGWPKKRLFLAMVAAVLPFGPFVFDRKLSQQS